MVIVVARCLSLPLRVLENVYLYPGSSLRRPRCFVDEIEVPICLRCTIMQVVH